jgi:hypothetical protein
MKTLVKGQLLTYNTAPARDGRLKAVNLRLLNPSARVRNFFAVPDSFDLLRCPAKGDFRVQGDHPDECS